MFHSYLSFCAICTYNRHQSHPELASNAYSLTVAWSFNIINPALNYFYFQARVCVCVCRCRCVCVYTKFPNVFSTNHLFFAAQTRQ